MKGKHILLGVTGSIAAYKACDITSTLVKSGNEVKVIMTEAALKFVSGLTFEALSGNPVYTDMFEPGKGYSTKHISLSMWADILVIAPATADIISKIAQAIADDLLTTACLSLPNETPVVIAPAMNVNMWQNRLFQNNLNLLKKIKVKKRKKYYIVEPRKGWLACGIEGKGALAKPDIIVRAIKDIVE